MQKFTFFIAACLILLLQSSIAQDHSSRAYLGVHSNEISQAKAQQLGFDNPHGNYLTRVLPESAAARIGLQAFDYIVAINDQEISESQDMMDLLSQYQPGDVVSVSYIRKDQRFQNKTELTRRVKNKSRWESEEEKPFLGVKPSHDKNPKGQSGVRINTISQSTAAEMKLEDGDIITSINGYPLVDWHDLSAAIRMLKTGENITVAYVREGMTYEKSMAIKSEMETQAKRHSSNHGSWSYSHSSHGKKTIVSEKGRKIVPENTSENTREKEVETIKDQEVTMVEVSQAEAEAMKKEKGIDMPIVNNLAIEAISIFPNPNEGAFNLSFEMLEEGPVSIRIFSGSGNLIYQNDLLPFTGLFQDQIDLTTTAGTYFLMIAQGGKSVTRRVVVARP